MSSTLQISPGGVPFAAVYEAIHYDCFDQGWCEKDLKELLVMPGAFSFVATLKDQAVGFIICRVAGVESEVITLGVLRQNQRLGIASRLLHEAKTTATKQNASEMLLEVAATNKAAKELYLKDGFNQVGLRKNYYKRADGQREDALILKIVL